MTIKSFEYSGFLCCGGLPEYLWMNVPEAFFVIYK